MPKTLLILFLLLIIAFLALKGTLLHIVTTAIITVFAVIIGFAVWLLVSYLKG